MLPNGWFQMKTLPDNEAVRIMTAKERFLWILAGRRAYKTEICLRKLVMSSAMEVGWARPRYFYAAPTRIQAKEIAWERLKDLMPREWMRGKPLETELKINTVFGSMIQVIGLDQPQRAEGGGFNGGVVDERSDVKPRAIGISIMPALSDRNGWLIQTGVGKRQGVGAHSFYDEFTRAMNGEIPNGRAFHWESGAVLTESQLNDFREVMDDKDFREQFKAEKVAAGGSVFHNWSESNIRPCFYDPDLPLIVGSDFNVDPMCWIIGQVHGGEFHVIDEIWKRDTNTERTLDELWRKYEPHRSGFLFYGDAAGRARTTKANDTDYIQISNDTRFDQHKSKKVRYPKANPAIADRISSCCGLICNANGVRRLFVDPKCKKLIEDLESRVYKEYSSDLDDGPMQGHMTDALGYFIHSRFPRRLQTGNYSQSVTVFN